MSDEQRPDVRNEVSGDPNTVVQAANIFGGVHVNPRQQLPAPRQLTESPDYYTNNEKQLAELTTILRPGADRGHVRLAAIRGEPGSGRTALASHWGTNNGANYPDGQFYLPLTGFTDANGALAACLAAAGFLADQVPATLAGRAAMWRTWTTDRRVLMVIDDVVRPADVAALQPGPGPSAVLAVPVGNLAGVQGQVSLTPLAAEQSLHLLARRLEDRVAAEPTAARALVECCCGSAAALNVAADLIIQDGDTIAELVRQLERRGSVRHLEIGAVFDAAYDRLDQDAQRCYRALGAHPGAQRIIGSATLAHALGVDIDAVYHATKILSRASLVARIGADRFRLTRLLSEHAAGMAQAEDGAELRAAFLRRYRDHGLRCAETITPKRGWLDAPVEPLTGNDAKPIARAWLATEEPNLVAAVDVADDRTAVELCLALWPLYIRGEHSARMVATFGAGVARAAVLGDDELLSVLRTQLGFGYRQQQDWSRAADTFASAQHTESATARATAVEATGLARREQGDLAAARELLTAGLTLVEHLPAFPRRLNMAHFHLATVLEPDEALPRLAQAREDFAEEDENLVKIDLWRGRKLVERGDLATAVPILTGAARLAERIGTRREHGQIARELAEADPADAETHLREALKIFQLAGLVPEIMAVRTRMAELGFDPDAQP